MQAFQQLFSANNFASFMASLPLIGDIQYSPVYSRSQYNSVLGNSVV